MKKIFIYILLGLSLIGTPAAFAKSEIAIKCTGGVGELNDGDAAWSTLTFDFNALPLEQDAQVFADIKGNQILVNRHGNSTMTLKLINIASGIEVSKVMSLGEVKVAGANKCEATIQPYSFVSVSYKQGVKEFTYICGDAGQIP